MKKYILKTKPIEAVQWFKLGDHPEVKQFEHSMIEDDWQCSWCDHKAEDHGVLYCDTHYEVCPGDWILCDETSSAEYVITNEAFNEQYELFKGDENE